MPFLGVLPERQHLFKPEPIADVAVNDREAWRLYASHRQVYDKLQLAKAQGLVAYPCSVSPMDVGIAPEQALFVKPIVNLQGMSINARVEQAESIEPDAECFWTEVFEGPQTSTDCLLLDGKVLWLGHTLASATKHKQRPVSWQLGIELDDEAKLISLVESQLGGYTGICNLERIGERVIEMHLRGSNGFFDLYPESFLSSWVRLVDEKSWVSPGALRPGCVYSVFGEGKANLDLESLAQRHGVSIRADHQTPDRIAIIQAASYQQAAEAAAELLTQ